MLVLALAAFAFAAQQQPFGIALERVANGLQRPVLVTAPAGDAQRLFVLEKDTGHIRIVKGGSLLATPFLDLGAQISPLGEGGLLGLAFHPAYSSNGRFYVFYADKLSDSVVAEFHTTANPDVADPASKKVVIGPIGKQVSGHFGGSLAFGPDGMLYVSVGDDDGSANGQSGTALAGKLLRLDVDIGPPHIPPDNPFVGDPTVRDEIWALGLRNPWRMAFDRASGDLYVSDVGAHTAEEISFVAAGAPGGKNFGWHCMEGSQCTGLSGCTCNSPALTLPLEEYLGGSGIGCAIIGGHVYRGCGIPALYGRYLYGDFCSHRIFSFAYDGAQKSATVEHTAELQPPAGMALDRLSSFGEDGLGELYLCDFWDGDVYRIVSTGPATYCSAKVNSCGGLPAMGSSGTPSASASAGFVVRASGTRAGKLGLLLYGDSGPAALPFQGGLLCVGPPVRRSVPVVDVSGTPGACDGVLQIDMNAFAAGALGGHPLPALSQPGTLVHGQFWGRDTQAHGSLLADGLRYLVCP